MYISDLQEGAKILVLEADDTYASYTLVHHGYGSDDLSLLWRDSCTDTTVTFNDNADTFRRTDNGAKQNIYLNETFYGNLPEQTRGFIQLATYPVISSRSNLEQVMLEMYVCTPSARELHESMGSGLETHDAQLNCLDTIASGEIYWTRSVYTSQSGRAFRVSAEGSVYNATRSTATGVRPCFCVSKSQFVTQSSDQSGYIMTSTLPAPTGLCLNGAGTEQTNQQINVAATLSWPALEYPVGSYAVWRLNHGATEYTHVATVPFSEGALSYSYEAHSPSRGHRTVCFRVSALAEEGSGFTDSGQSDETCSISTKPTNVYYFDGLQWKAAVPFAYTGEWKHGAGLNYYDGETWISPGD